MHPKNPHKNGYQIDKLIRSVPELKRFIKTGKNGRETIDFSSPSAVRCLNEALMTSVHGVKHWTVPVHNLTPPVPGRLDYLLTISDALQLQNLPDVSLLDIGTGASGIYAFLAATHLGWNCTGSDIDKQSIQHATSILRKNPTLSSDVSFIVQPDKSSFFKNIIQHDKRYTLSVCNPPFYRSAKEAAAVNKSKNQKLGLDRQSRNFAGTDAELWCPGGERRFIEKMIEESKQFGEQVSWFTCLISDRKNLNWLKKFPSKTGAKTTRVVELQQGQKTSRVLCWQFQSTQ